MSHQTKVVYLSRIFIPFIISILITGIVSGSSSGAGSLRIYDSTVTFQHFDFKLNPDNTMKSYNPNTIVKTMFATKVIENKYLKVTLLPDYGGRILSVFYKPTGHEELYQNPIGTPYGMGGGSFYYNWLMVYGGIFPTFPEPEHGKTWCLPWEAKIITRNSEQISVEMSLTDGIAPVAAVPGQFNKGKTGITCITTTTLFKDKPYVMFQIKLINPQAKPVDYEYWTCTTLAPGSEPGKTLTPANSEIIAPISQVKVKNDWWPWMGIVEKPTHRNPHIFEYKNLASFSNWQDMGIAYAYPEIDRDWWGVVNHENEEGIFRIANNKLITPGLKLWTWGCKQSYATNPKSFGNSARPYIELWAGNSREFFTNAKMAPNEEKIWDEYYIPTVGLAQVTHANQHALVFLDISTEKNKNQFAFKAKVFTTHPYEPMSVVLSLKGAKIYDLVVKDFKGDPGKTLAVNIFKQINSIAAGEYSFELILKSTSGEELARTSVPFVVKKP